MQYGSFSNYLFLFVVNCSYLLCHVLMWLSYGDNVRELEASAKSMGDP